MNIKSIQCLTFKSGFPRFRNNDEVDEYIAKQLSTSEHVIVHDHRDSCASRTDDIYVKNGIHTSWTQIKTDKRTGETKERRFESD